LTCKPKLLFQAPSENHATKLVICLSITVIIRINALAFIKFLALKMRRIFEGGVYSREALIANLVTTTVNLLCHLNVNLTNTINSKKTKNKI